MGRAGYLNNPAPDYPAPAVRQGWQGTVLLRVRVLRERERRVSGGENRAAARSYSTKKQYAP